MHFLKEKIVFNRITSSRTLYKPPGQKLFLVQCLAGVVKFHLGEGGLGSGRNEDGGDGVGKANVQPGISHLTDRHQSHEEGRLG